MRRNQVTSLVSNLQGEFCWWWSLQIIKILGYNAITTTVDPITLTGKRRYSDIGLASAFQHVPSYSTRDRLSHLFKICPLFNLALSNPQKLSNPHRVIFLHITTISKLSPEFWVHTFCQAQHHSATKKRLDKTAVQHIWLPSFDKAIPELARANSAKKLCYKS